MLMTGLLLSIFTGQQINSYDDRMPLAETDAYWPVARDGGSGGRERRTARRDRDYGREGDLQGHSRYSHHIKEISPGSERRDVKSLREGRRSRYCAIFDLSYYCLKIRKKEVAVF